ncbi:uncharacterized protein LOC144451770 [Glandiceps talaboti]
MPVDDYLSSDDEAFSCVTLASLDNFNLLSDSMSDRFQDDEDDEHIHQETEHEDEALEAASHEQSLEAFGSFIHEDILTDIGILLKIGLAIECFRWTKDMVCLFLTFVNTKFKLDNNFPELARQKEMTGKSLCFKSEGELRQLFEGHRDVDMIKGYLDCWETVLDFPMSATEACSDQRCINDPDYVTDKEAGISDMIDRLLPPTTNSLVKTELLDPNTPEQQTVQKAKRKRGRPRKPRPAIEPPRRKKKILWKFLMYHLHGGDLGYCMQWVDKTRGIFRFISKHKEVIAIQWGKQKGHKNTMTYQKMARALRDYTKKRVMERCRGKLHYKFSSEFIQKYNNDPLLSNSVTKEYATICNS